MPTPHILTSWQSSVPLLHLPLELLYLVSSHSSSQKDVNALARCNKQLYHSLNVVLYRSDMRQSEGYALRWAAKRGRSVTARKVFWMCRDMELPAAYLREALVLAMTNCAWGVMRILIDNGADVNTRGGGFGHILQTASWKGDVDFVRSLIDKGADVDATAGHYGTALQAAAWNGHERVAELLINKGAQVNAQGGNYGNALQAASSTGHQHIVKQLICHGAVVNAKGGFFGSALQAACWRGDNQIVETLLQAGVDPSMQTSECENALTLAWKKKKFSTVRLLLLCSIRHSFSKKLALSTDKGS
jgi:ankyrin repeat protein